MIDKRKLAIETFHAIELGTFCNVEVHGGVMPLVELTLDDNLYDYMNAMWRLESSKWQHKNGLKLHPSI